MRYLNIALISGLIFAPLALSAAEAVKSNGEKLSVEVTEKPKLTRENLLAHGFKQSEKNKDSFVAEHARLGDVESALGFQITALRPTVSQARTRTFARALSKGSRSWLNPKSATRKAESFLGLLTSLMPFAPSIFRSRTTCPQSRPYGRTVPRACSSSRLRCQKTVPNRSRWLLNFQPMARRRWD